MIEYRSFRNSDPPQLVRLWHSCGLGRGAADGLSYESFDRLVWGQHYFDPQGLIVAYDGERMVGFVHAGFRGSADELWIDQSAGAICAVLVDPDSRRQGIGRELVQRAETYLRSKGATAIQAGAAAPCDGFYLGLYSGSQLSGFLESDAFAAPFFAGLGYQSAERYSVLHRQLADGDPMNFRLSLIRRKMEPQIFALPEQPTFWWFSRYGRQENVHFRLVPKSGGDPVASVTVGGLDLYVGKWGERAIGISDLVVHSPARRQGHAQALLVEVFRRMRQEMVTLAEAHVAENNSAALAVFKSVGFRPVDAGVVYRKL